MKNPTDFMYYDNDLESMTKVKKFLETKDIDWTLAECYIVWEAFSDEYCAQFLCVSDELLEQFIEWLEKEEY